MPSRIYFRVHFDTSFALEQGTHKHSRPTASNGSPYGRNAYHWLTQCSRWIVDNLSLCRRQQPTRTLTTVVAVHSLESAKV